MNPKLTQKLKNVLEQAFYQHEQMHGEVKDIDTLQNEMSNFYDED